MVNIDMTAPDPGLTPGVDLWEVIAAEEALSSGKDKMLKLKFCRVSSPGDKLDDNIMLAGKGWSIGKRKLAALLSPDFKGELDVLDLVHRRLWLSTGISQWTDSKGAVRDQLKVMIDGLKHAGYQRAEDIPPGCTAPTISADDIPF